jgi:hypothetical protein
LTRNGIFTLRKTLSNYEKTLMRSAFRLGTFCRIRRRKRAQRQYLWLGTAKEIIFWILQWMKKDDSEPISA